MSVNVWHRRTASEWQRTCEEEAKRLGYQVVFSVEQGRTFADFFNGETKCFEREWTP